MRHWKSILAALVLLVLLSGVVYAAYSYTARVATTVNVVTVAPDAGITATPETDVFDIVAGETSVIMVTVENVGTDTLNGIVFEAPGAPDGWIVMTTGGWGNLAPGDTVAVQVWLTVPPGVAAGAYGFDLVFHGVR